MAFLNVSDMLLTGSLMLGKVQVICYQGKYQRKDRERAGGGRGWRFDVAIFGSVEIK
jgi:hypothetical protein